MSNHNPEPAWDLGLEAFLESHDIRHHPCDECGVSGQTAIYVDGHCFSLCPECAWRLTDKYHANGWLAPWEAR